MYAIYVQLNDYDQPEYVAAVFEDKPSAKQLLEFISSEYSYITEEKITKLLQGKTIYDTPSGKAEPWCYTTFKLQEIKPNTWL